MSIRDGKFLEQDQFVKFLALCCEEAQRGGATFSDMRFSRVAEERFICRDREVEESEIGTTHRFGIRVWIDGAMGFASGAAFDEETVRAMAREACLIAHAHAKRTRLIAAPPVHPRVLPSWVSPHVIDPFSVNVREKEEWLLGANGTALSAGATHCESHLWFVKDFRLYGSSDGVVLSQEAIRSWAEVRPSIVDSQAGKHAERKTLIPPQACGYELLEKFPPTEIEIATEHAKMKLKSPTVRSGTKDLVIAPSNLWLTIHETVGHSTESDRILGFEANFAGTTFVKPVDIGHLVFGSPLVNFTADRTSTNGLASSGFDDEGIPTSKFQLVKDGILVDVPTSSDTARILGFERSNGCAFCETAGRIPILRMPNISLEPGARACSLENLISAVEDGLLVIGDDCWSIDQKRHQFQFSAQELWEIRRGRITNLVKDGAYHGRTREFWSSLTALGDASTVGSGGTFFCGKGEPLQASPVSHGAPAALFRNVEVSQLGTAR